MKPKFVAVIWTISFCSLQLKAQNVYISKSEYVYNKPDESRHSEMYVAGTEFKLIDKDPKGLWCKVKDKEGKEVWIRSEKIQTNDPRTFFVVKERQIIGYLVGDMSESKWGGNATSLVIVDTLLGEVRIEIKNITSIRVSTSNEKAPVIIETTNGNKYIGRTRINRGMGNVTSVFFIVQDATIFLDSMRNVTLERVQNK